MTTLSSLQKINGNFKGKDILDANQFSKRDIDIVFKKTDQMKKSVLKKGGVKLLEHKVLAPLFFEPSSRTFSSFSSAMLRLGGSILPLPNMESTSVAKGESFTDTIKVFSCYSDALVVRHPEQGKVKYAADISPIPVINAGDGIGEHPTQALYDLYTINESLNKTNGLHVVFFGELGRYRPVNSLSKLLALYPKNKITFVSPPQGKVQTTIIHYLKARNIEFVETTTIDKVIGNCDVLYVTRVKKEFMSEALYKKIRGKYVVDKKLLTKMKKKSLIMHALPRIDEIATEVDSDQRAVYLKSQVINGLYVRMALLALVLGKI